MLEEFPNSSKKIQTPLQFGTAATSLQLTVTWTTVEMSTGFSTCKMRQGAARISSSAVPPTTAQRSTSRSSHSTVPWTTARTSSLSAEQQRLREVGACLPVWYSYGNEQPVHLLHREWRHFERNHNRRLPHHRRFNSMTTHHHLQSYSKCQHLPINRVNSPSLGRYTKILICQIVLGCYPNKSEMNSK